MGVSVFGSAAKIPQFPEREPEIARRRRDGRNCMGELLISIAVDRENPIAIYRSLAPVSKSKQMYPGGEKRTYEKRTSIDRE